MLERMHNTQVKSTRAVFHEYLKLRGEVIKDFVADNVLALSRRVRDDGVFAKQEDDKQLLFSVSCLAQRVAERMEEQDPTYAYDQKDVMQFADIELNKEVA